MEGKHFEALIRNFIQSINEGHLPNVESAWEFLAEREYEGKYEESVNIYERGLGELLKNDEPKNVLEIMNGLKVNWVGEII